MTQILMEPLMSSIPVPPVHVNTDEFWARVYGRKVLAHLFDEDGARLTVPTCSDESIAFHARMAASYGMRVQRARETAQAHEEIVRRGYAAVMSGFGFRLLRDR